MSENQVRRFCNHSFTRAVFTIAPPRRNHAKCINELPGPHWGGTCTDSSLESIAESLQRLYLGMYNDLYYVHHPSILHQPNLSSRSSLIRTCHAIAAIASEVSVKRLLALDFALFVALVAFPHACFSLDSYQHGSRVRKTTSSSQSGPSFVLRALLALAVMQQQQRRQQAVPILHRHAPALLLDYSIPRDRLGSLSCAERTTRQGIRRGTRAGRLVA